MLLYWIERKTLACPYIDEGLSECQKHMRLEHLALAISICGHEYEHCKIFTDMENRRVPVEGEIRPVRSLAQVG